jgi:cytochrome c biogenesis protein CcmG/thiol:disulfide interchange protein DsbE
MSTIGPGATAPEIELKSTTGSDFKLSDARKSAPVLAAFFKVECPTCQYALPFLQRLHRAYGDKVRVVAISQNPKADTEAFMKQYGVTMPVALDDTKRYPASNAYKLTNVPSVFLITPEGKVEHTMIGWVKPEFEQINAAIAKAAGAVPAAIFKPGEEVKEFKAG